ncbi:hypothetical protein NMG60_11037437 [Bertholletia excelsa]
MGKRKERRHAAMMAAGRRLKLDLFAEPSGESGGSSAQDELGGETDPRHRAGSPNSPSSSGKQPENPLLLLGQYSDDELDENSSKGSDHATAGKSSIDDDGDDEQKVKGPVGPENPDTEKNASMNLDDQIDNEHITETDSISKDALQKLEDNDHHEIDFAVAGDLDKEVASVEETSAPGTSSVRTSNDVHSSWKVVLHEDSNQYYYWNIVTGETSWVVPDVLAQGNELTTEQKTYSDSEGKNQVGSGADLSNSTTDVQMHGSATVHSGDDSMAANVIHDAEKICEYGTQMMEQNNGNPEESLEDKKLGPDLMQTEAKNSSGANDEHYHETSSLADNVISPKAGGETASERYFCKPLEDNMENDLWCSVMKHGENLLERLKSMKSSQSCMQGDDWISKYLLEVEIRLSDIKSLLAFGSSLLPFWVHCESQLKELEVSMEAEAAQYLKPSQIFKAEAAHKPEEYEGIETDADGNGNKLFFHASENPYSSADTDKSAVNQNDSNEAGNGNIHHAGHVSAVNYPNHSSSVGGEMGEILEAAEPAELAPKTVITDGEDVDMDVDMEVEDPTPAGVTRDSEVVNSFMSEERPILSNQPEECESFMSQQAFGIPPPPDEEWIPPPPPENELVPPPPPDNELVPPPPPEEPPETMNPPLPNYPETIQPSAYAEQHALPYPSLDFEFYSQANTEYHATNVYTHAEGCQVAVPHQPLYYEVVPSTYPIAAPVVAVNSFHSVAYYNPQNGSVVPGPVVSCAPSAGLNTESSKEAFDPDQVQSLESSTEAVFSSLSNPEVGVSTVNGHTGKASVEIPSAVATTRAPVNTSVAENVPESSTVAVTTATASAKSAVSNVHSKAPRGKKRTVAVVSSLRSNKKVSSLVDKWKAAKEELHEDEEDEPENAYEILEKKRQREIEEWRAQQIASGEAKDNANFQPLGGDWRERVKRKRAQLKSEAVETPLNDATDGNQMPDLTKLSRDLPSGWQAYWDESSKQVYYGNVVTSETTWTRPAK